MEKTRRLIKIDGTVVVLEEAHSLSRLKNLIGADSLAVVDLHNGMTMVVDDIGVLKRLPRNHEATRLYHGICKPGTTNSIVGDVAVVPNSDFGQ